MERVYRYHYTAIEPSIIHSIQRMDQSNSHLAMIKLAKAIDQTFDNFDVTAYADIQAIMDYIRSMPEVRGIL